MQQAAILSAAYLPPIQYFQKIKDIFKRAFGYNYDEQKNDNLQLFSS